MDQQTCHELVVQLAKHLTGSAHVSFDDLAAKSKENRRVRNVFVFYSLTDPDMMARFLQLERMDAYYATLKEQLFRSLKRLERDSDSDVVMFARYYLDQYFSNAVGQFWVYEASALPTWSAYDASAEMAKLMQTIVYRYKLQQQDTPELRRKLEERRKHVKLYM